MTFISNASHRGAQGEHLFEGHFLQNGIFIAAPKHYLHRVDYVVEWNGQLVRVNVKTLYRCRKDGSDYYAATLNTSCKGGARLYTADEIDYFGIVSLEYGHIWMVPLSAHTHQSIHWHPPQKKLRKQFNSFNWDPYLITDTSTVKQLTMDSYLTKGVDITNSVKLS
ncbi:MAG: hypothetical protein CL699_07475 [Chloroflexi bacterium]|nr:hypothetical protein [Chloroflexota bacterium]